MFKENGRGIVYPKNPSYRITDVAKAIAPNAKIKIIGIRPGEKLHEEMITETDSLNTIDFDNYYVIMPSTKQWDAKDFIERSNSSSGKMCEFGFSIIVVLIKIFYL